jgi:hypothetical protein
MMMNATIILKKAKEKISDPAKWNKDGTYYGDNGCMCIMGAIMDARIDLGREEGYSEYELMPSNDIEMKLDKLVFNEGLGIRVIQFNDYSQTTHQDVMNFMDKAIAESETWEKVYG